MPIDALGPNILPDLGGNPVSSPPRNAVRTDRSTFLKYKGSVAAITTSGTSTWMMACLTCGETREVRNDDLMFNPIWSALTVEVPFPVKLPVARAVVTQLSNDPLQVA